MGLQLKLWRRSCTCVALVAVGAASAAGPVTPALPASREPAPGGEAGEGGEGGEGGASAPSQYRLLLDTDADPKYDGTALASAYVDNVHAAYRDAAAAARALNLAIASLVDAPTASTLQAARRAWLDARRPYLATEAFRFYEGPIDGAGDLERAAGPEPRLNAWPLNEAVIDAVAGQPGAGLVHAPGPLSRSTILAHDQASDEADVTTGWHAIEFLLWGQDTDAFGPGARAASDYAGSGRAATRRRHYLALLGMQLQEDLDWLEMQWRRDAERGYAREFLALEPHEALGRMLTGAALLAGHELASERLAVALDSGAQEDEQSCFSDSTWQDFVWGLVGIKRVYFGRGEAATLARTIEKLQPRLALEMERRFAEAERRVAALHDPFDRILASAAGSRERGDAEAAVAALQQLASGLRDSGRVLGVLVIVPGV